MGQDFTVTVYGERGEEFDKVFGTRTVHVRSPFPSLTRLGSNLEPESVYMLDMELLTEEQRTKMIEHIAQKFDAQLEVVAASLAALGLPIKASDTMVMVTNPQKWLMDVMPGAEELEELDIMSDMDDDEVEDFASYDDY